MTFQVQVRGTFAGSIGNWRPAITGTLNQTGESDESASTADEMPEAEELLRLVIDAGARPDDTRIIGRE